MSTSSGTTTGVGGGAGCVEGTLVYATDFSVPDGPWPAPWTAAGGVETADIVSGRARLVPLHSGYPLARMKLAGTTVDSEATFSIELENAGQQGMGFYARQNGGYLADTTPNGQGYAIFSQAFSGTPGVGAWYEAPGAGEVLLAQFSFPIQSGTVYRERVRVEQEANGTRIRGRIWVATDPEPATWTANMLEASQAQLQNLAGGFAIDAWHNPGNGVFENVWIDDVTICAL